MSKKIFNNKIFLSVAFVVLFAVVATVFLNRSSNLPQVAILTKPSDESFLAPSRDWPSEAKVEDYFIEHLNMTPEEAQESRTEPRNDDKVMLRLREKTTLEGLLSNLEFYGFVRDKEALLYAIEHTKDTTLGKVDALTVGESTIDLWSSYQISENMSAWEIAEELINHPTYFGADQYNYMFMP